MSGEITVDTALRALRDSILVPEASSDHILAELRSLQRLRMSREDLILYVTELRRRIDPSSPDADDLDQSCLLALDLVHGYGVEGLRWDPPRIAAIYVARVLDRSDFDEAAAASVLPNDLLPPRPFEPQSASSIAPYLSSFAATYFAQLDATVAPADIFRVPKAPFTTRPAALLPLQGRVAYEALADQIRHSLMRSLPREVMWPRGEKEGERDEGDARTIPLAWDSKYVVKADIQNFYGTVSHSILRLALLSSVGVDRNYALAVESFLTATMRMDHGLPQGQPASDVFATALLLPVDRSLRELGVRYVRFQDDYFFSADSLREGQAVLRALETRIYELGLSLGPEKTKVMKRATYESGLGATRRSTADARRMLAVLEGPEANKLSDDEVERLLLSLGVDDERLWDLFYHRTATLDELVQEVAQRLEPPSAEAHLQQLDAAAALLRSDDPPAFVSDLGPVCRASMIAVAASDIMIRWETLSTILRWFPSMVPEATEYFRRRVSELTEEAAADIVRVVDELGDLDWVSGWLTTALTASPLEASIDIAWLRGKLRHEDHPLTAAAACQVLLPRVPHGARLAVELASELESGLASELLFMATQVGGSGQVAELLRPPGGSGESRRHASGGDGGKSS